MKKFNVSYTELVYYLTQKIEAKDEDEAREKFIELLNNDDVPVNETDLYDCKIEEIKENE